MENKTVKMRPFTVEELQVSLAARLKGAMDKDVEPGAIKVINDFLLLAYSVGILECAATIPDYSKTLEMNELVRDKIADVWKIEY